MLLGLGFAIASLLFTALITWGWIKIALAKQIHDQPERRRLHTAFIPRAGGIGIALVMAIASLVFLKLSGDIRSLWMLIAVAIISYGVLGFWDDLQPMHARKKLFLHFLVAIGILLLALYPLVLGPKLAIVLSLAYLLFVNIWNFMDGSNGMIGVQSFLCAAGFLGLSQSNSATHHYAIILAASCLGFLPFNFPVARVFLGDVGSHVLGAAVVSLALLAYGEGQWQIIEILCLFSALWIDAILTLIRRGLRGFNIAQSHRSHLYQYAIRRGKSHMALCVYYALWTLGMILLVGFSRQFPESTQLVVLVAVLVIGCALHQAMRLFVLKSGRHPTISKSVS